MPTLTLPEFTRVRIIVAAGILLVALAVAALSIEPATSTDSGRVGEQSPPTSIAPDVGLEKARDLDMVVEESGVVGGATTMEAPATDAAVESVVASPKFSVGVEPRVIQTANMQVTYRAGRIDEAFEAAQRTATALGGYVVNSSFDDSRNSRAAASVTLRVPTNQFDRAIERLGENGRVVSVDVSSQDVSEEYVDIKSRLRHDRAVEARLVALLAKAKTINETLAIQSRLDTVQEQIEIEQGRLTYLDRLTELSTITVTLSERGAASRRTTGDDWGVRDAFADAAERFVDNVNSAIVALGGWLPALLLAVGVWLVGRSVLRRRRDRTAG
jgi:hypothetical protein